MCVPLVVQHLKHMLCIILSSVACLAVHYFSTLSHRWCDFQKNVIEHKMCVLIFTTNLSEASLTLRRIWQDIIINVHRSSYSCQILMKLDP